LDNSDSNFDVGDVLSESEHAYKEGGHCVGNKEETAVQKETM
jgi:hypothetical protein